MTEPGSAADERRCPFCHNSIDVNEAQTACPVCAAQHHDACWRENDGCSQTACPGKEESAVGSGSLAPPQGAATVSMAPELGAAAVGGSSSSRSTKIVLGAAGATCLLAVSALLAVVLLRGGGPSPTVAAFTSPSTSPQPVATGATDRRPGDEILAVMRRHHTAATEGRWDAAFALLSSRKKAEKSAQATQNGIDSGAAQYQSLLQSEVQGALHAARARIRNLEIKGHVAQFELAIPRIDGRCYVGTTWALREDDGRWTFDPGYENRSAERRAQPGLETADTSC